MSEKEKNALKELRTDLEIHLDHMAIFKNFDVEKIMEEFKKYQDKWINCPQKHCIFHGAYTVDKIFDEKCKDCDQEDYYTVYTSE